MAQLSNAVALMLVLLIIIIIIISVIVRLIPRKAAVGKLNAT
jgi:hypothetical protein